MINLEFWFVTYCIWIPILMIRACLTKLTQLKVSFAKNNLNICIETLARVVCTQLVYEWRAHMIDFKKKNDMHDFINHISGCNLFLRLWSLIIDHQSASDLSPHRIALQPNSSYVSNILEKKEGRVHWKKNLASRFVFKKK